MYSPENNDDQDNDQAGSDLKETAPKETAPKETAPKKHWMTEKVELTTTNKQLQTELEVTKQALERAQSDLTTIKTAKSISQGVLANSLLGWPGVDYSKPYCEIKMSVREGSKNTPADGAFRKGKGPVFNFKDGYCVTNNIRAAKEFLTGRSGWSLNQRNAQSQINEEE